MNGKCDRIKCYAQVRYKSSRNKKKNQFPEVLKLINAAVVYYDCIIRRAVTGAMIIPVTIPELAITIILSSLIRIDVHSLRK